MITRLRYIGQGAYRPDLPARDIDAAELVAIAARAKTSPEKIIEIAAGSGLYALEGADAGSFDPTIAQVAAQGGGSRQMNAALADLAAARAAAQGATPPASIEPDAPQDLQADAPKTIEQMGRDELRAAAKDLGIGQGGSKAELVERIRAKLAEADDTDATAASTASDTDATESATEPEAPQE